MTEQNNKNIAELIGVENVKKAVKRFYENAFVDPIIGHFFFQKDHNHLIEQQTDFALTMLGSKEHSYRGKPLTHIHGPLNIRPPHFGRRQVLLQQALREQGVKQEHIDEWIRREQKLRPLIMKNS